MAPLKQKGDRAELEVARDLIRRGYRIAFPYGEDWDFDLIFQRPGNDALERVQVKYTRSDGNVIEVRPTSQVLTNGRVKRIKRYTARTIDWLAFYDATSERCYYLSAAELGEGRDHLHFRLTGPLNNQGKGIGYAVHYLDPTPQPTHLEMEPAGIEPATS